MHLRARIPLGRLALTLLLGFPGATLIAQEVVSFQPGMVITRSVRIEPGTYRIAAPESIDSALIVIRGDRITVDFSGVRLEGIDPEADPDLATGVAVRIDGGDGVTVQGVTIRGYRFGILARRTRNLRILDSDLSYGWKPRLFSVATHESIVDWLSFHDNEEREWMRFGASIYLEDIQGGEVRRSRSIQGMNALLMTRTDSVLIQDNDFSYNSGLGIGLYRSSFNTLVRNRLDYDVRGYSEGVYQRGQDSAGLLLYEQSSHNVVASHPPTASK
jgi:parallel beta-helix repeat protein